MRVWRLALLVVLFTIVQVTVFTHLRIFGVVPDLGLRARGRGRVPIGSGDGRAHRLRGRPLLRPVPRDPARALRTLVRAHRVRDRVARERRVAFAALDRRRSSAAAGGLIGGLCFIGIGGLVGVPGMWTGRALVVVVVAALYDALLAPFVFFLVRRLSREETPVTSTWSMR